MKIERRNKCNSLPDFIYYAIGYSASCKCKKIFQKDSNNYFDKFVNEWNEDTV